MNVNDKKSTVDSIKDEEGEALNEKINHEFPSMDECMKIERNKSNQQNQHTDIPGASVCSNGFISPVVDVSINDANENVPDKCSTEKESNARAHVCTDPTEYTEASTATKHSAAISDPDSYPSANDLNEFFLDKFEIIKVETVRLFCY